MKKEGGMERKGIEVRSENDACVIVDQQNNKYFFENRKEKIGGT